MDHLFDRELTIANVLVTIKFGFHVFTDHRRDPSDDRPQFIDIDSNEKDRVFDPQRWSWSYWLPDLARRFGTLRIVDTRQNYTFKTSLDVGPAFSAPYVLYFDIGKVRNKATIVNVNSAYIDPNNPPHLAGQPRFSAVLAESVKTDSRPGSK
jgi:hypothetical protein